MPSSILIAASLAALAAPPEEPGGGSGGFVWRSSYVEGLAEGRRRARPLLVYFPAAREADEPRALGRLDRVLGSPAPLVGVRVGADEILELKERFHLKRFPAMVLVDRRENAVTGWEGGIPPGFLQALLAAVRKLEKEEAADLKAAAEARRLADGGDLAEAYRRAAPLLASPRTSPEALEEARAAERVVLAGHRGELRRALAAEGLAADEELKGRLERLKAGSSHPGFQAEVDRELRRLRRTRIGVRKD